MEAWFETSSESGFISVVQLDEFERVLQSILMLEDDDEEWEDDKSDKVSSLSLVIPPFSCSTLFFKFS